MGTGGALGGDVLHEAEPWGLGFPWGDANVTGQLHSKLQAPSFSAFGEDKSSYYDSVSMLPWP